MSVAEADALFQFKPFYAILQDGLDRMFDVVKSEEFQFFVNGECYASPLAEAILFHRQFVAFWEMVGAAVHLLFRIRILTRKFSVVFLALFVVMIVSVYQKTKHYHF
jgi:hypothetical protein